MMKNLKSAILIPFIVVFLLTFSTIYFIHFINHDKTLRKLSDNKVTAISNTVETKLEQFLNEPLSFAMALSHMIDFSSIEESHDLSRLQRRMQSVMTKAYHLIPQIELIGFGCQNGDLISFKKHKDDSERSYLILKDARTKGILNFYSEETLDSAVTMSLSDYDPTQRPWYQDGVKAGKPSWSSVYNTVGFYYEKQSTISAVIPTYNDVKNINGVVAVDIRIETLIDYLKELGSKYHADIYIFDKNRHVIASSYIESQQDDKLGEYVISKSMRHISGLKNSHLSHLSYYKTEVNGDVYYNTVIPYINSNDNGFQWYVGISVSKQDLLKEISTLSDEKLAGFISVFVILILGLMVGILRLRRIIVPIQSITQSADKLAHGQWDDKIDVTPDDGIKEIRSLVDSFNTMYFKLQESFNILKKKAYYDELTELKSQSGFIDRYTFLNKPNGTAFIFSVKSFDNIKNSLGYHVGDLLLKEVAQRLRSFIGEECLIARLEGGDFAVFSPEQFDFDQSKTFAKEAKKYLTRELKINNLNVAFRVSVGIVLDIQQYSGMEQVLRNGCLAITRADKAYSHVFHYESSVYNDIEHQTTMLPCIKEAIKNKEFTPFYQPIVELKTGKIVAAEALARWHSPELGFVSPVDFIPVAEEHGFIEQLGEAILYQACRDTVQGIAEGKWPADIKMHVNISVIQVSNVSFLSKLQNIIVRTKVEPKNLSLEITESSLIDNEGIFSRNLSAIISMGIHVSIDDFGTGYSSLSYLQDLQFDCLKIDRAFINTLEEGNYRKSLTAMILNISDSMGKYVVAEGIETAEQANLLVDLNCQLGQGFYFSRPVPYEEWPEQNILPAS